MMLTLDVVSELRTIIVHTSMRLLCCTCAEYAPKNLSQRTQRTRERENGARTRKFYRAVQSNRLVVVDR